MTLRMAAGWLPPSLAGLVVAAALLAGAGCGEEEAERTPAARSAITTATAPAPAAETGPWLKTVPSGETQTRSGLEITVDGVALGTVEGVLADIPRDRLGDEWANARTVVAVSFSARNPTDSTITVPIYTSAKLVANDQQSGIDFLLSDVEVSILPGVRQDMQVVAPISRYSAEQIRTVRFVLEMSVVASPEETFDFAVTIP